MQNVMEELGVCRQIPVVVGESHELAITEPAKEKRTAKRHGRSRKKPFSFSSHRSAQLRGEKVGRVAPRPPFPVRFTMNRGAPNVRGALPMRIPFSLTQHTLPENIVVCNQGLG